MPYKIRHRGSGYKVTTPNHPGGFSKHPLSREKAVAQLRAIKMHANESAWVESVIHGNWPEAIVDRLLNEENFENVSCPQCGGDGVPLGSLGRLNHYRCRQCGWTFSDEPEWVRTPNDAERDALTRPKADIMPGGGVGGPVGDNTAIGVAGGGGV